MARAFASLKFLWDELVGTPPAMPAALRDQLSIIQFDRLRQRIPMRHPP